MLAFAASLAPSTKVRRFFLLLRSVNTSTCAGSPVLAHQLLLLAGGVCDGNGNQVGKEVTMDIQMPTLRRELLDSTWADDTETTVRSMVSSGLNYPEALYTVSVTEEPPQATIILEPTSGVEGAETAVTSSGDIGGALLVAAVEQGLQVTAPEMNVIIICGDGVCSPGEPRQLDVEDTNITCPDDCPIILGECPSPSSSGVGDSTLECGGNGSCNPSTLTCDCDLAYAGDDCGYCASGFGRNEQICELILQSLLASDDASGPEVRQLFLAADHGDPTLCTSGL